MKCYPRPSPPNGTSVAQQIFEFFTGSRPHSSTITGDENERRVVVRTKHAKIAREPEEYRIEESSRDERSSSHEDQFLVDSEQNNSSPRAKRYRHYRHKERSDESTD